MDPVFLLKRADFSDGAVFNQIIENLGWEVPADDHIIQLRLAVSHVEMIPAP